MEIVSARSLSEYCHRPSTLFPFLFRPPSVSSPPLSTCCTRDVWHSRPLGFPTRSRFKRFKVPLEMIPRPVEAHEHAPVDSERSPGSWILTEFHPTYVQLLLLCAVLFFLVLVHVLRSFRLSRAGTGCTLPSCRLTVEDKELYEHQNEYQLSEKSAPQSSSESAPGRGYWWVDALLGRDVEEEAIANAARSMVIETHHQLAFPVQNDPELQGYKDSILYHPPRQQRPPISMAKLIMSRHVRSPRIPFDISVTDLSRHFHNRPAQAHPPRRPRSPPKPTPTTATTTQPHSRPPSRLASSPVQVV